MTKPHCTFQHELLTAVGESVSANAQVGNNSVLAVQAHEEVVEVFDNWCALSA